MSYTRPSTNVVTIDGGSNTIASGVVAIQFNLANRNSSISGTSFTTEVIKIGSIEFDYDYIESIGDVNEFTINVPRFEVVILDELSGGVNFIDFLNELYPFDLIVAQVTYNNGTDYYYTTRDQCEFSYLDRTIKMDMQAPLKYQALAYGKNYPDVSFPTTTVLFGSDIDAVTPKDFISTYLRSISSNQESPKVFSDSFRVTSTSGGFTQGQKEFFFNQDVSTWSAATDFEEATSIVKQLALRDAAVIGSWFGTSYYVPRYFVETSPVGISTQITLDDFEKLELDISYRDIRDYDFSMNFSVNTDNLVVSETINDIGRNDVNVSYPTAVPDLAVGEYDFGLTPARFELLNVNTSVPASDLVDAQVVEDTFKKVFRVATDLNNPPGTMISGTILGIDKLKPFQYFYVAADAGVHPLVNGRKFRPSYLNYDIVNDKVDFEAYEF